MRWGVNKFFVEVAGTLHDDLLSPLVTQPCGAGGNRDGEAPKTGPCDQEHLAVMPKGRACSSSGGDGGYDGPEAGKWHVDYRSLLEGAISCTAHAKT